LNIGEQIDAKTLKPLQDLQLNGVRMNQKLDDLSELIKPFIRQILEQAAQLTKQDFSKKLPEVGAALSLAKTARFIPPPETVTAINSKLLATDNKGPEFWGAAAAMINFRSSSGPNGLPNCLDKDPEIRLAEPMDAKQTTMKVTPAIYRDCQIELDAPRANAIYVQLLRIDDLELRHCRVIYRGGPLIFPTQSLGGGPPRVIRFVGCVFEFYIKAVPPGPGKTLVSDLLSTSDVGQVNVKFSGS